ncbi:MAG: DEAD/DEAH box helicase [Alphaproteobacteria bacterium]
MSFTELGLSEETLRAVSEAGYTTPTPIQAQAIPIVLMGRDVLGCAQTGTGKTAGFTLPMIDILSAGRAKARMPRSLILEPTRELAAQVAENFDTYGKYAKLTKALLIGGESMGDQLKILDRGADVLIATPGRLLDLFERGKILLRDVKVLVIDEADRMLDMGFIPDIEKIVSKLPPIRQTLFFSATMPPEIRRLADKFLSNPKEITVSRPATTATTIEDAVVMVSSRSKREALRALLKAETVQAGLIFCNRKREVDVLVQSLQRHGLDAAGLHGDMTQDRRTATLEQFKQGKIHLLVASDVAARGLDIDDISHVFNFDVPYNAEDYVHRIGRTGRAGRSGKAFTLATPEESKSVAAIEHLVRRKIPVVQVAGFDAPSTDAEAGEAPARGRGRSGERRSRAPAKPRAPRAHAADRPVASPTPVEIVAGTEEIAPAPVARVRTPHVRPTPARAAPPPSYDQQPIRQDTSHEAEDLAREADLEMPPDVEPVPSPAPIRDNVHDIRSRPAPRHEPAAKAPQRPRRPDQNERPAPVGFGEHVPAFLRARR